MIPMNVNHYNTYMESPNIDSESFKQFNLYGNPLSGRQLRTNLAQEKGPYLGGVPYPRPIYQTNDTAFVQQQSHFDSRQYLSPQVGGESGYNDANIQMPQSASFKHSRNNFIKKPLHQDKVYQNYPQEDNLASPNQAYNVSPLSAGVVQYRSVQNIAVEKRFPKDLYPNHRTSNQQPGYPGSSYVPPVTTNQVYQLTPGIGGATQSFPQGRRQAGDYSYNPFKYNEEDADDDGQLERVQDF